MYIVCVILCLFSALSRREGALQISIIKKEEELLADARASLVLFLPFFVSWKSLTAAGSKQSASPPIILCPCKVDGRIVPLGR